MILESDRYHKEIVLPLNKVYRIAFVLIPVISLIYLVPYLAFWLKPFSEKLTAFIKAVFSQGGLGVLKPYLVKGTILLLAGIVWHELLHGLGWIFFTKKKFRSLSFGIMMPELAPYAHCKEPLPVYGYRIGILLPGIILGIFPAVYGIVTGSFGYLFYGILFTWAASGDFIMFWWIRKLDPKSRVMDHPEKLGCILFEK